MYVTKKLLIHEEKKKRPEENIISCNTHYLEKEYSDF